RPRTHAYGETKPGEGEDQAGEKDRGRRADPPDERHDDRARDPGADEVGEVQPPDPFGLPGEECGDHHADGDEGREQRQADAEQGEPDDEVRVVVEELERDDARVADLEQQGREADEQDLEGVATARRTDVLRGFAHTRRRFADPEEATWSRSRRYRRPSPRTRSPGRRPFA